MPTVKRAAQLSRDLSFENLPENALRAIHLWGPCFCEYLDGETCTSCIHAQEIEAKGLDWEAEFQRAVEVGEAVLL
jgi:hypothetical protein